MVKVRCEIRCNYFLLYDSQQRRAVLQQRNTIQSRSVLSQRNTIQRPVEKKIIGMDEISVRKGTKQTKNNDKKTSSRLIRYCNKDSYSSLSHRNIWYSLYISLSHIQLSEHSIHDLKPLRFHLKNKKKRQSNDL